MTYPVKASKSLVSGWKAETAIELEQISDTKTRVLKIVTDKQSTIASVMVREDTGGNFTSESFTVFQDYMKRIAISNIKRATEKSVTNAHEQALRKVDEILPDIKAQYGL